MRRRAAPQYSKDRICSRWNRMSGPPQAFSWAFNIRSKFLAFRTCNSCGKASTASAGPETRSRFRAGRSEEHTSELQSLMRISYAVFCLKKKNTTMRKTVQNHTDNTNQYTSSCQNITQNVKMLHN